MKAYVAGVATGAALVGLLWWLAPAPPSGDAEVAEPAPSPRPREPPTPVSRRRDEAPEPPRNSRRRDEPAEAASPASDDHTPFPPGEAWLRVGEGYVFGETSARRQGAGGDIVCFDISGGASLQCPNGAALADTPLGAVGLPDDAAKAAELVTDAPLTLPPGDVEITPKSNARRTGIALVRSAAGAVYRVSVAGMGYDKSVLGRSVRLRFVEVPAREGGGVIALPSTTSAKGSTTLSELNQIIAAGAALPGDSFSHNLHGDYERISQLPAELVLKDGKYLLVEDPLATTVEFNGYSGLVAAKGIAATGLVRIRSYMGVAVRGEMAGEIDVGSYAYVHVSGNLTGKLRIRSYATVVIDGDLAGEVEAASYVTFLLRGRLLGKLTIRTGNSKFWFQEYMGRGAAESLGRTSSGNELHLRTSDMANGVYKDIPGWGTVGVGEDTWTLIAK